MKLCRGYAPGNPSSKIPEHEGLVADQLDFLHRHLG
jgi:hypothetical protein